MTTITDHDLAQLVTPDAAEQRKPIEKVSIVISKGSLEGVYPGLIMANGARMEGIEASVFFTFFGLDAITKKRQGHLKVATVGNPGMHIPTLIGALPGMSWLATKMMARKIEQIDIPPVPEFVELIADSGAGLYACKATVDMFGLDDDDFVPQVTGVITVGEFYEQAAGGEIVFT
jgi:peroxiredoxin family protein